MRKSKKNKSAPGSSGSADAAGHVKKGLRAKVPNILIALGIIVMIFPFITEAYGYFKSMQLVQAWDQQAALQKQQAETVREGQSQLISQGQLPDEESIIAGPSGKAKKRKKNEKPFPKTKIIIPKIGVDQVIMEGTGPEILQFGPGHYIGTVNPGDKGNCSIAGHRVTYTHPFNRLDELSEGDTIILETIDYSYEYQVENMEVTDPADVKNLKESNDPRITLTTCNPKYSAKTRLNVMGVLVNSKARQVNIVKVVSNMFDDKKKPGKPKELPKTEAQWRAYYASAKRAIKDNQMDGEAYIDLARACLVLEKYPEYFSALKTADILEHGSPEIQKLRDGFDEKKAALQQTIAANGDSVGNVGKVDPSPYFELGNLYMVTGEYQEAAKVYTMGVDVYPYAADPYIYQAQAYEKIGRDDLALAAYNQALKYDPDYSEALNNIQRIKNKKPEPVTANTASTANILDTNRLHYRFRPQ